MATLRALQSAANNQGSEAQMTWKALNASGSGMGSPNIDYDRFAARWETDPMLKQLVDRFDGNGLVIKTNNTDQIPQGQNKEREISRMAKRAANKNRKFD